MLALGDFVVIFIQSFDATWGRFYARESKLFSAKVGRNEYLSGPTTLLRVNLGVIFEALLVSFQDKSDESEIVKLCMLLFLTVSN